MFTALGEKLVAAVPLRYQRIARQFIKFIVTGTIGATVDFGIYNLLTRGFDFDAFYTIFGQKMLVANNISVILAIMSNFVFNKYWTFRDRESAVLGQWAGYFTLNAFTWALNQILVSFFTFNVPLMAEIFGSQRDNAAKALAIGFILFINFFGSKFLIFGRKSQAQVTA